MQVALRSIGNSRGILIPKPILEQTGLVDAADLRVKNGVIEIHPLRPSLRQGWEKDCRRLAESENAGLAWPEFANAEDADWTW